LQAQRFAAQAQGELDALQARLHAMASEQALMLQAKEAELQRVAVEAQYALQARDAEHASLRELQTHEHQAAAQRLSQHIEQLQAELSRRDAELRAVYASRSWRWTAMLRRGGEPLAEPGP
jgi:hypothetical protein